jgi:DNA-binding response OmpR family regulator
VGTILVVQADPVLRAEWTELMRRRGHAVLEAGDIGVGVGHAREGGIDVVVLDSVDPSRSAKALIDELQRLPEPPPLILVSSSPTAPEQSAHLGAVAFVPKPCLAEDVVFAVDGVVSARPRGFDDDEPTGRRRLDDL